jgi:CRP-like cAMP-binding protein
MSAQSNWPRNRLLLALPSANLTELMPELELILCDRGEILMDADSSLDHVFFPDSGVVSVVAVYEDGSIIEMATIGREGCTAVQAIFGATTSSVRLLVQIPGGAAKMSRSAFARAMGSMPSFQGLMYAYVQAFIEQVMVSVACNGAHSLKQRLARWLLMMRDRADDDALQITQNPLAEMLGVQRPTITNAARELEGAGLIARGRRQVTILDRQGLVAASCECYQLVRSRLAFHLQKRTREKRAPVASVMYITDDTLQRAYNQDRRGHLSRPSILAEKPSRRLKSSISSRQSAAAQCCSTRARFIGPAPVLGPEVRRRCSERVS